MSNISSAPTRWSSGSSDDSLGDANAGRVGLGADPPQQRAQVLEVYRLRHVIIEASFFAPSHIFFRAKTAEGDSFERLFPFRFAHKIVAAAIRQTDVADERIELFFQFLQRCLDRFDRDDFMSAFCQQAREDHARVLIVINHE